MHDDNSMYFVPSPAVHWIMCMACCCNIAQQTGRGLLQICESALDVLSCCDGEPQCACTVLCRRQRAAAAEHELMLLPTHTGLQLISASARWINWWNPRVAGAADGELRAANLPRLAGCSTCGAQTMSERERCSREQQRAYAAHRSHGCAAAVAATAALPPYPGPWSHLAAPAERASLRPQLLPAAAHDAVAVDPTRFAARLQQLTPQVVLANAAQPVNADAACSLAGGALALLRDVFIWEVSLEAEVEAPELCW